MSTFAELAPRVRRSSAEPAEGRLFMVAVHVLVAGMVVLCLLSLGMLVVFPTLLS